MTEGHDNATVTFGCALQRLTNSGKAFFAVHELKLNVLCVVSIRESSSKMQICTKVNFMHESVMTESEVIDCK